MVSRLDYSELDPGVVGLVRALNRFPAVSTIGSCAGHEVPVSKMSTPAGMWWVTFQVAHSERGWRSLEFLAWFFDDLARAEFNVNFGLFASPPYLNTPGRMLMFQVMRFESEDPDSPLDPRDEADNVGARLDNARRQLYEPVRPTRRAPR